MLAISMHALQAQFACCMLALSVLAPCMTRSPYACLCMLAVACAGIQKLAQAFIWNNMGMRKLSLQAPAVSWPMLAQTSPSFTSMRKLAIRMCKLAMRMPSVRTVRYRHQIQFNWKYTYFACNCKPTNSYFYITLMFHQSAAVLKLIHRCISFCHLFA